MMMQSASMWQYKAHKLVAMGHINFEDHAFIKIWQACKKMNVMSGMFKVEKKWGNYQKQFVFVVRSCVYFWNFGVCSSMTTKNAIEKL